MYPPTVVLRHRRENLKKCSLRGLEGREDFIFYTYPKERIPTLSGYVMLALDAPLLSAADGDCGIFLLDATWRYADVMGNHVEGIEALTARSLPSHYRTAYPRRQDDCPDPSKGLASVEAIYIAYRILGRSTEGLLDNYHWRDSFLEINGFNKEKGNF